MRRTFWPNGARYCEVPGDPGPHQGRVERVAGDRHPADREHVAALERARPEPEHRVVGRAAAEIADQRDLLAMGRGAERASGGDRLWEEVDLLEAGELRRLPEARLGEGVVLAVEVDRPAKDDAPDLRPEVGVRPLSHLAQERRDQLLRRDQAAADDGAAEGA
jgi:hypothetical protein